MAITRRTAVLGFHKIGPAPGGWNTWMYIPAKTFTAQLTWLRDNGWVAIDLSTFLAGLTDPAVLPERSALITFDDGCKSLRREALSCLRRFKCPAVVFVPTAFIGGRNGFDQKTQPDEDICSWQDLRELERHGVSVQSHGVSHRAFSRLTNADLVKEARRSKATLERGLKHPVEALAYPFGDGGRTAQRVGLILRRAGYRAAFLYKLKGRPLRLPAPDVYRLQRVAMGPDTDLAARLS